MATLLSDTKDTDRPPFLEFGELVSETQNLSRTTGENTEIALTNIVRLFGTNFFDCSTTATTGHCILRKDLPLDSPPTYNIIKGSPYLRACINGAFRMRPSLSVELPCIVPAGGLHVAGEKFDENVTLSSSTEIGHRDSATFQDLTEEYRPEQMGRTWM